MHGIVPPNITIISSQVFVNQDDQRSVQMLVGCSDDGEEVVFWTDERDKSADIRELKAQLMTDDSQLAAEAFNNHLRNLASQGFMTSNQPEISAAEINTFRPGC